jgi:hypothetical protein
MPPCRTTLMAFVVLMLLSIPSSATDTEPALGKAQDGVLTAGKAQSFVVSLSAGDFAQIKLDPHGKELVIMIYDPWGNKFRSTTLGPDEGKFNFVVDRSGTYGVGVSAKDKTVEAAYTISLDEVVTLTARLAPPKPVYESPRIKALKASVESGKRASVDPFWEEVNKQGAPLIEPLPGNDKDMLVTFLWRGTPDTHNVLVLRLPYAADKPDNYHMIRLGETDVWYKTIEVGKRMRFDYRLVPNVPSFFGTPPDIDQDAIAMIAAASATAGLPETPPTSPGSILITLGNIQATAPFLCRGIFQGCDVTNPRSRRATERTYPIRICQR